MTYNFDIFYQIKYINFIHPEGEFIYILYLSTAWTEKS